MTSRLLEYKIPYEKTALEAAQNLLTRFLYPLGDFFDTHKHVKSIVQESKKASSVCKNLNPLQSTKDAGSTIHRRGFRFVCPILLLSSSPYSTVHTLLFIRARYGLYVSIPRRHDRYTGPPPLCLQDQMKDRAQVRLRQQYP